ncbi:hypothetical protein TWF281_011751 [Arthrobotrys megalospora]
MDRPRPTRYRQVAQTTVRVPPQYLRSPDADYDDDDEEEARTRAGIVKVLNWLALLGIFTLLFLTLERFAFDDSRDPCKCAAVTNEGRWLESYSNSTGPLQTWQPRGCLLHTYKSKDITTCLPKRRILYIGDQGVKSLYYATVDKLSPRASVGNIWEQDEKFISAGLDPVTVEFIWDPYLNTTRLGEELEPWKNGTVIPEYRQTHEEYDPPAVFIIGVGIRFAERGFDDNPLRAWRGAVDRVTRHMRWGPRPFFFGGKDIMMLAPVEQPAWEKLGPDVRKVLMPSVAIDMNKYVYSLATIQGLDIARAWLVSADDKVDLVVSNHIYNKYHSKETEEDGIVLLKQVAEKRVDMVLGLRCNDVLKHMGEKIDSNCCVSPKRPNWLQFLLMVRGLPMIPLVRIWRWMHPTSWLNRHGPDGEVLRRLWRLIIVVDLCFYADRSPVFYHLEKLRSIERFNNVIFWVFVVAALTLRKPPANTSLQEVENRTLTEWKGAALAIYLIASYVGGSTEFSTFALIFVHSVEWTIELLTSGAARTGGFYFARKLADLNYVVFLIVVIMRTEYVLYRVPALLSFWFVVVYMTIKIRPWGNKNLRWYSGKTLLSAGLVLAFFGGPGSVYKVALKILDIFCGIKWDGELVKGMVLKDFGAVYVGMGVGWIYVRVLLHSKGSERFRNEQYAMAVAFFLGISYSLVKIRGSDILDEWHTYTSLAKIAIFGFIRLPLMPIRERQSVFFMWLGSIEAAVLGTMNHSWLAANGKGVLDLGFWGFDDDAANVHWAFWTLVFGYNCWALRDAREATVGWVLGVDKKSMDEAQDRKKVDSDLDEMADGDDIESGALQRAAPKGWLSQFGEQGWRRAVLVIVVVWLVNRI